MKKLLFAVLAVALINGVYAQGLYMPRNITEAYLKGTRDMSGQPGRNYWQNKGVYDIAFKVNTERKVVSGTEQIEYTNNSPDDLRYLALRFVNNIHKNTVPRTGYAADDYLTTGLVVHSITYNGVQIPVNSTNWGTAERLRLPAPVPAHSTAKLQVEWEYPLSKQSGREGQIDSGTLYCAYAYPRVSVYDDYNGWDMLPHIDGQEFYNDFNDYRYSITVPRNWLVWSTGELLNAGEVLSKEAYARYNKALTQVKNERVPIATAADMEGHSVTAQAETNTWKYAVNHVTDVCFAVSNHYVWDAGSVLLKNKRVLVQAAYNADAAADFGKYINWLNHNITWYSTVFPAVEYPFKSMTAVQGFANMEYPGMINDETVENLFAAQKLADHEVAHSYFPFYMGTNETRYAFMDEGWAVVMEYLIGKATFGAAKADSAYMKGRVGKWIASNATEQDQPIITMSTQLSGQAYRNNSYGKASLSYFALKDLLGDELFMKALHHYMDTWHGKHPIPWDYFNCMKAGSGQDLDWFFNNWFFTNCYSDLTLTSAVVNNGSVDLQVKNTGGFYIPFDVRIAYTNGTMASQHYKPNVWKDAGGNLRLQIKANSAVKSVTIDNGIFMDANLADNVRNLY